MRQQSGLNRKTLNRFFCGLAFLLFLVTASILGVRAQPEQRAPAEAKPFIVERRQIGDGTKTDAWLRLELRFGEPREKCRTWRFETQGLANGHAVLDLREPANKSIILDSQVSPQHLEFVLGDADCSYRIRIERKNN